MALKILDRRFISVIGKGGTGKTTVSAALAILAASRGKRVLVAMSQARERMSAMLETEFIGPDITPIPPTIDAANPHPAGCPEETGIMTSKGRGS